MELGCGGDEVSACPSDGSGSRAVKGPGQVLRLRRHMLKLLLFQTQV